MRSSIILNKLTLNSQKVWYNTTKRPLMFSGNAQPWHWNNSGRHLCYIGQYSCQGYLLQRQPKTWEVYNCPAHSSNILQVGKACARNFTWCSACKHLQKCTTGNTCKHTIALYFWNCKIISFEIYRVFLPFGNN